MNGYIYLSLGVLFGLVLFSRTGIGMCDWFFAEMGQSSAEHTSW